METPYMGEKKMNITKKRFEIEIFEILKTQSACKAPYMEKKKKRILPKKRVF